MQKSKTYTGSIGDYKTAGDIKRPYTYGATGTISCSEKATDFFLSTVADFLKNDCGVDAAYEVRPGNEYKWLWIYGCPVFAYIISTATAIGYKCYAPFSQLATTSLSPWGLGNGYIFSSNTTGAYNFTLYYYGNPEDVCVLYLKNNLSTSESKTRLVVLKTVNILNDAPSVTLVGQDYNNPIYCAYDLDESGNLIFDTEISAYPYYKGFSNILNAQKADIGANPGKLPLVHILFGVHYCKHMFLAPNADMIPRGGNAGTLVMPEIKMGTRTFLNLAYWGSTNNVASNNSTIYAGNTGYFNLGLVET